MPFPRNIPIQDDVNVKLYPPTKTLGFLYATLISFFLILILIPVQEGDSESSNPAIDILILILLVSLIGWIVSGIISINRKKAPLDPQSEITRCYAIYEITKKYNKIVGLAFLISLGFSTTIAISLETQENNLLFDMLIGIMAYFMLISPLFIVYFFIVRHRKNNAERKLSGMIINQNFVPIQTTHANQQIQPQGNIYCADCGSVLSSIFCSKCGRKAN